MLPVSAPDFDGLSQASSASDNTHFYYDSMWNSVIPTGQYYATATIDHEGDSQLFGYLQWLEERKVHGKSSGGCAARDHDNNQTVGDAPAV